MANLLKYGNDYDVDQWLLQMSGGTSGRPSEAFIDALNTFVANLKLKGVWTNLDRLWIFATEQQQHARISIKNPTSTPVTEVNAPTWTANSGYTGNGTNSYLHSNFHLRSGTTYTLNSASIGGYSLTNLTNTKAIMGTSDGITYTLLYPKDAAGLISYLHGNATPLSDVVADSLGMITAMRTSSTNVANYKNGILLSNHVSNAIAIPNQNLYILARGVVTDFDTRTYAMAFAGSGNIDQSAFYTAFQNFAITRGFNV